MMGDTFNNYAFIFIRKIIEKITAMYYNIKEYLYKEKQQWLFRLKT